MPKGCLFSIPEGDGSRGIEDLHIIASAWVFKADPYFARVLPFKPRPTKLESHHKLAHMKHSKATKLLGTAHGLPIYLAFGPGRSFFGGPKESPLDLVDEVHGLRRYV
jgi:hypothetical protein